MFKMSFSNILTIPADPRHDTKYIIFCNRFAKGCKQAPFDLQK